MLLTNSTCPPSTLLMLIAGLERIKAAYAHRPPGTASSPTATTAENASPRAPPSLQSCSGADYRECSIELAHEMAPLLMARPYRPSADNQMNLA